MYMSTRKNASVSTALLVAAITLLLAGCGGESVVPNSPPPVANSAPVIAGTAPGTVIAGSAYSFQPTATDANGDNLTFTISGKPAWATFSTSTGALTGTPSVANVGTYANIIITVSDGAASAVALPAFSITVTQSGAGTAALTWTAPTQNSDGSALTDLAGYYIYYGTNTSQLSQSVQVIGAGQTSHTLTGLSSGTWYFAIAAYNSSTVQSARSNVATKTVL